MKAICENNSKVSIAYHYDGSIDGFFCCVFEAYTDKSDVFAITSQGQLELTFDTTLKQVQTDLSKSRRVIDGVIKNVGTQGLHDICVAFLSCNTQKELIIYYYLRQVFEHGRKIHQMLSHKHVIAFNELHTRVTFECHRFYGFARFMQTTNNIFVAPIRPDNDILELIMPHFVKRFNVQRFVIIDVGRCKAAFFDGKQWYVGDFEAAKQLQFTQDELELQQLWKQYCDTVSISSRTSERRRRQFMPVRYWEFMPELR